MQAARIVVMAPPGSVRRLVDETLVKQRPETICKPLAR